MNLKYTSFFVRVVNLSDPYLPSNCSDTHTNTHFINMAC